MVSTATLIILSSVYVVAAVYSIDNMPVFINPTLVNASSQATSSILLVCSCPTAIMSTTTVVWRKNHLEITANELQSNSSRYSSSFDTNGKTANFIIYNPQSEDTGIYDCKVLINGSHVTSSAARVTVADTMPTCGYEVVRGLDVEVQCPIEEIVPLKFPVFWSKDEAEVLSGKKHFHLNSRSLKIAKAEYNDTGVYQCVVLTADGLKSTQLKLTVRGPPEAPLQLSLVNRSRCSLLQWKIPNFDGNSPIKSYNLTCKDHYSGRTLTAGCNGDKTRLVVSELQIGIHYDCTLQAINDMGCSNNSNVVHVFCPAIATQALQGAFSDSNPSTTTELLETATSDTVSSVQFVTTMAVAVATFFVCLGILFVWIHCRLRRLTTTK
jgi:hypothetical protein